MADYNINAVTRRKVFTGSAGLGPYAFTFEILDDDDLAVYFNATKLTKTTDYSVTINANGTGSVTLVVNVGGNVPQTPIASDAVIVVGARDIERTTDFVTAGDLLASSLNEQLDSLTIFDQQIAEEEKRTLQAPVYDPAHVDEGGTLDMTLPAKAARAGKYLQFNSTTGNPEAGPDSTDVTAIANIATDIATLADIQDGTTATNAITTAASNASNISTVAGISSSVTSVAGDAADIGAVATDLGGADTIGTVAGSIGNVNTTAGSIANVNTAAGSIANINTAAGSITNINTTAANITDVNTFAVRYRIGSSDPTSSLDAGDLFFNTTSNVLKVYNGSAWVEIQADTDVLVAVSSNDTTAGYLNGKLTAGTNVTLTEGSDGGNETLSISSATELSGDSSPQLGGSLDVVTHSIVSTSNRDINITPNGTGNVALGNFTFNVDQTVGAGQDNYLMTYDHSSTSIGLEVAPAGGAGFFQGDNGNTGDTTSGKADIFRTHQQQLDTDTTISSGDNSMCAGPLTVASGVTLTVSGNLVIA